MRVTMAKSKVEPNQESRSYLELRSQFIGLKIALDEYAESV